MFEEGQLYSPVTPGARRRRSPSTSPTTIPARTTPPTARRRNEIAAAALAWRPGEPAPARSTTPTPSRRSGAPSAASSRPKHERLAVREYREARRARSPSRPTASRRLDEVSDAARAAHAAGATCPPPASSPLREFYGSLGERVFHSTQYVRHPAVPLYTPEPDIIHEVIGHGHLLATPTFGELHRLAGVATHRLRDEESAALPERASSGSRSSSASSSRTASCAPTAPGSSRSYGEIDEFRAMEHRPLDLVEMGTADYDITHYQPVLYRAESVDEVVEPSSAASSTPAPTNRSRSCAVSTLSG